MRFFLGPFVTLLARTAALSRVPVAIVPFRFSPDQLKHIRRGFVSPVGLILGCMDPSRPPLVVAFELSQKRKAIVADALAGASAVVYLTELDETARTEALRNTGVLLTFNTSKELRPGEAKLLNGARGSISSGCISNCSATLARSHSWISWTVAADGSAMPQTSTRASDCAR